jgi:hypothetical protein
MCTQLLPEGKLFVAQISARVVRMFQQYSAIIDPESEPFLTFMNRYLKGVGVKNPKAIPYPELYKHIKQGIRAYLQQLDSERKTGKGDEKSK